MDEKQRKMFRRCIEIMFRNLMYDAKEGGKYCFNADFEKLCGAVYCMWFAGMISEETEARIKKLAKLIREKYKMPYL